MRRATLFLKDYGEFENMSKRNVCRVVNGQVFVKMDQFLRASGIVRHPEADFILPKREQTTFFQRRNRPCSPLGVYIL
jgi:hypothetical protein